MDFAVQVDHRVKLKEIKKTDIYWDLSSELKKIWNMKMTVIRIVVLGTVTDGLVQGLVVLAIRVRVETIKLQYCLSYLPTPPLGQDMTQGQFLSGV